MSLTFYYSPMSTAVLTNTVIEELDLPCEKITVDIRKGDTRTQEFLRLNPNGKVPVVIHDGTPIWESAAITMYLGEVFGVEKGLYPAPGPKRGEAMRWIVWANVTLGEAINRWLRHTSSWIPDDQKNAKAGEVGLADLQNCLRILDDTLKGKQFLLGDYTLADTHMKGFVDYMRILKVDLTPYSVLGAWSQRCAARPGYARAMPS